MDSVALKRSYLDLTTPHVADACLRLGVPVRCAPSQIKPAWPQCHVVGRVRPARHCGSVDIFLEALEGAARGDVLVIDNGGRLDEACIGDLVTLETQLAGLAGIVIWGLHRDTAELRTIRLPVFSLGALPSGPLRLDPRDSEALQSAMVGPHRVTSEDVVMADDDGVIFLPLSRAADIAATASQIRDSERQQAARVATGTGFRVQVQFADFLAARAENPELTFRQHLRGIGGAVEE